MSAFLPVNYDIESIKEEIIKAIQSKNTFTDYDFSGSSLSTMIDILAQNTQILAFIANLQTNESFLDTAQIRKNVVSHAKKKSYTPRSKQAARAIVDIVVKTNDVDAPSIGIIEKGVGFTTVIDNRIFDFVTLSTHKTLHVDGEYVFNSVDLYQGRLYDYEYTVTDPTEKFLIPNAGVDTDTIKVTVQQSDSDLTLVEYKLAEDILSIDNTSTIYYLEEEDDEKFSISMGDDVLGKSLVAGNIVKINYLVTDGEAANLANSFDALGLVSGYPDVTITTLSKASGGGEIESMESVRINAPKSNKSKHRAIIDHDYEWLIPQLSSSVKSVKVWGGEDNIPPKPGFVLFSVNTYSGIDNVLSDLEKDDLISKINKKNVGSIKTQIVDADLIYLDLDVKIYYSDIALKIPVNQLEENVRSVIGDYSDESLTDFSNSYANSQLTTLIDNSDISIQNSVVNLDMIKKVPVYLNKNVKYTIQFFNAIVPETLVVSDFRIDDPLTTERVHFMRDDGNGVIDVYKTESSVDILVKSAIGTVDYDTGEIVLTSCVFLDADTTLDFRVQPKDQTVIAKRNIILSILTDNIKFEMNIV